MFEPENIMKRFSGNMILPKFGEYKYYTETERKTINILFWIRDSVAVFKKETQLLIEYGDINVSDIDSIDIVVNGDYGQRSFHFPMKILYIMNNGNRHESIQPMGFILCKKDNGI